MSPQQFFSMTPREIGLAIEGRNNALERDYNLMFLAHLNASGMLFGGKDFKYINPFEKKEKAVKEAPTKKAREETLDFIKSLGIRESHR